jgi:N-acetylglutamate synthase-like GNAT family acetyltransferase
MDGVKTGLRTLGPASLRLSYSQAVAPHLRGGLRELSHLTSAELGKGHGTRLLKSVIDEADKSGITLMLTADTESLADWYSRNGFQLLQEDPRIMVRLPARVMAAYG